MARLKFGSPAWRKKYMKKGRRKTAKKKNSSHRRGTVAKRKRMREMIRESKPRKNPPSSWTKVKAFRVVRKNGRKILEVKK
jgi:hypothetical protein